MTPEYAWRQHPESTIWWLKPNRRTHGWLSVGLMHRDAPSESRNPNVYQWRVARWVPIEAFIAYLPNDMPEAEALDVAKMLILLSLKENQS
jgi:hypothetical protein